MRTVQRDKRPVAYAFYSDAQELVDDEGNYTGEYDVGYTEPVKALMNVSGGRGQADIALFGLTQTFARTATTEDLTTAWNTDMVFWVESDPDTEPYDYRVVAISRTINQVVLALAEVERQRTSETPPGPEPEPDSPVDPDTPDTPDPDPVPTEPDGDEP